MNCCPFIRSSLHDQGMIFEAPCTLLCPRFWSRAQHCALFLCYLCQAFLAKEVATAELSPGHVRRASLQTEPWGILCSHKYQCASQGLLSNVPGKLRNSDTKYHSVPLQHFSAAQYFKEKKMHSIFIDCFSKSLICTPFLRRAIILSIKTMETCLSSYLSECFKPFLKADDLQVSICSWIIWALQQHSLMLMSNLLPRVTHPCPCSLSLSSRARLWLSKPVLGMCIIHVCPASSAETVTVTPETFIRALSYPFFLSSPTFYLSQMTL